MRKHNVSSHIRAILFWLIVWEIISRLIGQEILLVSPVSVVLRLFQLITAADTMISILFSFSRIIFGFLLASFAGILTAALASVLRPVQELLTPVVAVVKATPVASFIILVLIWVPSRNLSVVISFLMVFPIMYTNALHGIRSTDRQLLEMAQVFRIPRLRRVRYIYLSQMLPDLQAGFSLSLGLCWKAGIAAEVIGIPDGSIGEKLYQAKVYLETPDLFAWTVIIVVLSVLFEKGFLWLINRVVKHMERQ